MTRIAINGFGRIGRQALKIALEKEDIEIVAINDLMPPEVVAHLLTYDSVYGIYSKSVKVEVDGEFIDVEGTGKAVHVEGFESKEVYLYVGDTKIRLFSIPDPKNLPWGAYDIDVVLECTGFFDSKEKSQAHIDSGAKNVVISAPAKGDGVGTFLMGVNIDNLSNEQIISNGSCTTNCVGPVTKVMMQYFGVSKAMMTTIHSYTATQMLVDGYSKSIRDYRRMRAAGNNIVPTSTGAAISTTEAISELKGKFDGTSLRVPTIVGSITDFVFLTKRPVTIEEVNEAFVKEAETNESMKGILSVTREPIVSSDIIGNSASAIVDLGLTNVVDGDMVKVMAWYDNEVGYSNRLIEIALELSRKN